MEFLEAGSFCGVSAGGAARCITFPPSRTAPLAALPSRGCPWPKATAAFWQRIWVEGSRDDPDCREELSSSRQKQRTACGQG